MPLSKDEELELLQLELSLREREKPNTAADSRMVEETSPMGIIKKLAPSNILPGVAIASSGISKATGLTLSPISPVSDPQQLLRATQDPVKALQDTAESLKRGVMRVVDPSFVPTPSEQLPDKVGTIGGMVMDLASVPSTSPAKGGIVSKAAETADSLAGVPKGSSFQLLRDPSKWTKIFTSDAAKKAAYQKAVDAGEMASEMTGHKSFIQLADEALTGTTKTIRDQAEVAARILKMDKQGIKMGPGGVRELITFRKAANDEIGRLQKVIENGILNEKPHNIAVTRLVNYKEMADRVNSVLDRLAPNFRAADKVFTEAKAMEPFRKGIKPFIFGAGNATIGTGLQQGNRIPVAMADALEQLSKKRRQAK